MRRLGQAAPLCYAVYPVLLLYGQNLGQVQPRALLIPLLAVLGAGGLLLVAGRLLVAEPSRRLLLGALFWTLFFAFGHARQGLAPVLGGSRLPLLAGWLLLYFALGWCVLHTKRPLGGWARGVAAAGVLLVLAAAFPIARAAGWERPTLATGPALAVGTGAGARPNIYHLVLDGYGRADVLQRMFSYDNRPFLAALRRRGFSVADQARANYAQTPLSLAAVFRLGYLDDLPGKVGRDCFDRAPLTQIINDNPFLRFLKARGYTLVAFETSYVPGQLSRVDHLLSPSRAEGTAALLLRHLEFYQGLADLTPLGSGAATWLADLWSARRERREDIRLVRIRFALDSLPLPSRYRRPLFVHAHVVCPHPPFLLCEKKGSRYLNPPWDIRDGDHLQAVGAIPYYRETYPRQVRRLNTLVLAAVDRLLAQDPQAVILMHADHGSGLKVRWEDPRHTDMHERMAILLAARMPGRDPLPPDLTPVNLFRLVLNREFGASLPMLPNRCLFSPWSKPYHYYDVTDRCPPGGRDDPGSHGRPSG